MPVLKNPKHERFAQELAKGATVTIAGNAAAIELKRCLNLAKYYVYLLIDSRTDTVFYVGKGTKKRAFAHVAEWRANRIVNAPKFDRIGEIHHAGHRVLAKCLVDDLCEADALDTERWLIEQVGIANLTNLSPGEQSDTSRLISHLKDDLRRVRPYCRWKNYILPQFDNEKDIAHEKLEQLYWDINGDLTEMLAELEGRPYRKFPRMFQPNAKAAA